MTHSESRARFVGADVSFLIPLRPSYSVSLYGGNRRHASLLAGTDSLPSRRDFPIVGRGTAAGRTLRGLPGNGNSLVAPTGAARPQAAQASRASGEWSALGRVRILRASSSITYLYNKGISI